MGRLLLLFILVPAVELGLLIELGSRIGTLATLGVIAGTGVLGAALTRQQGLSVLQRMRDEVTAGRLPAASLLDAVIILVAGALLLTPGILTDAVGFLCLVPRARDLARRALLARLERAVREGRVNVSLHGDGFAPPPRGPMKNVTPRPRSGDVGDVGDPGDASS